LIFSQPSLTGFDTILGIPEDRSKDGGNNAEEQEQEFEFRLFSVPTEHTAVSSCKSCMDSAQQTGSWGHVNNDGISKLRIRIRSPSLEPATPGEGRFVVPFRGWQYYFTTPGLLSGQTLELADISSRRREYEDVAVSGTQLLNWAKSGTWVGHLFRMQSFLSDSLNDPITNSFYSRAAAFHGGLHV
jgi:Fungal protein of unknown function (DUF2011)